MQKVICYFCPRLPSSIPSVWSRNLDPAEGELGSQNRNVYPWQASVVCFGMKAPSIWNSQTSQGKQTTLLFQPSKKAVFIYLPHANSDHSVMSQWLSVAKHCARQPFPDRSQAILYKKKKNRILCYSHSIVQDTEAKVGKARGAKLQRF